MGVLDGKVALVTGAARGLGWGIARALGLAGARVCVTDINPEELARAAGDLRADGSDARAELLDVADRAAFQATVDGLVGAWGRLDVLVHNAIYMPLIRFEDLSPEGWQRQLDVGLGGPYNEPRSIGWYGGSAEGYTDYPALAHAA